MRQIENQWFRPALRLGRRRIRVHLSNPNEIGDVWSNYRLSRGLEAPVQKAPKHERVTSKDGGAAWLAKQKAV